MKKSVLVFLMLICNAVFADTNLMWKCSISDLENISWMSESVFERKALNMAFDTCKQESKHPESCDKDNIGCESFLNGISTTPVWQCTALDSNAVSYKGELSAKRDQAALNAKAKCSMHSKIPATCYMRMLTCKNLNAAR